MAYSEKRPKALDLSRHISDLGRSYRVSPLKGLQKYFNQDELISIAGGLPHESCFPFQNISADIQLPDSFPLRSSLASDQSTSISWLWRLFGYDSSKTKTTHITVNKQKSKGDDGINLATALQYGPAIGLPATQRFIHDFAAQVYKPGFSDFRTLLDTGSTDGWSRCVRILCDPGDTIITEEWAYPSALASAVPIHVKFLPVAMDNVGMRPDLLRKLLSEWDESKGKRPHVMYTVPVGQNPSGATMDLERKKAIYDICVEFDVVICEDDPYYFLQMGEYSPASAARADRDRSLDDNALFLSSLSPSFLKIDTQGRVIRLDSFSKTIAPGVRLGFFTCAPVFAERFERVGETTTQAPCGLGQALVIKLLQQWTLDGYVRWLRGLVVVYRDRRDFFINTLAQTFDLEQRRSTKGVWAGKNVYCAYMKSNGNRFFGREKGNRNTVLFEFVPPESGMFIWIKLNLLENVRARQGEEEEDLPEGTREMQFWVKLAKAGVLTAPGWYFSPYDMMDDSNGPNLDREGHLRISFSSASTEEMQKGVKIFEKTLREFLKV